MSRSSTGNSYVAKRPLMTITYCRTRRAQDMSHRGEGKAVLVIGQFSHNLSVSLNKRHSKEPEAHASAGAHLLRFKEHACSGDAVFPQRGQTDDVRRLCCGCRNVTMTVARSDSFTIL